jgi:hypothetical protein
MQIHWQQKWMSIPYNDSTVVLIGDAPTIPVGSVLQLSLFQSDFGEQSITSELLPPEFNALLAEFAHLFKPPTELPPQRDCDHSIPLIPGAHPMFVRPYRYAPVLKTEIERQVADMLEQGLIQKKQQCIFFAGAIGQEERQHLAFLCGLSPPKRYYSQREISSAHY